MLDVNALPTARDVCVSHNCLVGSYQDLMRMSATKGALRDEKIPMGSARYTICFVAARLCTLPAARMMAATTRGLRSSCTEGEPCAERGW